VKTALLFSLQL